MQLFAVDAIADKSCTGAVKDERSPVSFPAWKEALSAAPLTMETKDAYRRDILAFLHHCKVSCAPATIMLAKSYLEVRERQGVSRARMALRWFFKAAQSAPVTTVVGGPTRPPRPLAVALPPPAAADLGGADWERDLIVAARRQGLLWRSEETYRGWAARFARFLAPRSAYQADADDVAAFLTKLAVEQRASPATQKQAA